MDSCSVSFNLGPINSQGYISTTCLQDTLTGSPSSTSSSSSLPSPTTPQFSSCSTSSTYSFYHHGQASSVILKRPAFESVRVIVESFKRFAEDQASRYNCQVQTDSIHAPAKPLYGVETHNILFNFSVHGPIQQAQLVCSALRRQAPLHLATCITVTKSILVDISSDDQISKFFATNFKEISLTTNTSIIPITSFERSSVMAPPRLEVPETIDIFISGPIDSIEQAKLRVLIALDEHRGKCVKTLEIDQIYQNFIFGRQRSILKRIMEETSTIVYVPSTISSLYAISTSPQQLHLPQSSNSHQKPPSPGDITQSRHSNTLWISGDYLGTQRAIHLLGEQFATRKSHLTSSTFTLPHRKLDWLLCHHVDDLKKIMKKNGVLIVLPHFTAANSSVLVYGDCRANVERAIRSVSQLASQNITGAFWLLPASNDLHYLPFSARIPPYSALRPLLTELSINSQADIAFSHNNRFEIFGISNEVERAFAQLTELQFIKSFHVEAKFSIQLSNEHRDFVSGKKNGKINKIMKTANIKIKFDSFNEFDFLIELHGTDPRRTLEGLRLALEELPSEVSFFIPESFHKRIIGVGGKNIQRIMSQFHVYVKFSSTEEMATLGGYHGNEHNVVVRTPAKNRENLEPTKQSIMLMVAPEFSELIKVTQQIPYRYHELLLVDKRIIIYNIEQTTNSEIHFPDPETASDVIIIKGTHENVMNARKRLTSLVPHEFYLRVPISEQLVKFANNLQAQAQIVHQLRHDYHIALNIPALPMDAMNIAKKDTTYAFVLRVNREKLACLPEARDSLLDFLKGRDIPVYKKPTSVRARSGSFHAFSSFFSGLDGSNNVATFESLGGHNGSGLYSPPRSATFAPFTATTDIFGLTRDQSRSVKTSNSAHDLRARFNSTPDAIAAAEVLWPSSSNIPFATNTGSNTEISNITGGNSNNVLGRSSTKPWTQVSDSLFSTSLETMSTNSSSGASYIPTSIGEYDFRVNEAESSSKRGSDSKVHEKWREMSKPRSIPRATSMDLGISNGQSISTLPVVGSSTNSITSNNISRNNRGMESVLPFPTSQFQSSNQLFQFTSEQPDTETLSRYIANFHINMDNKHIQSM